MPEEMSNLIANFNNMALAGGRGTMSDPNWRYQTGNNPTFGTPVSYENIFLDTHLSGNPLTAPFYNLRPWMPYMFATAVIGFFIIYAVQTGKLRRITDSELVKMLSGKKEVILHHIGSMTLLIPMNCDYA